MIIPFFLSNLGMGASPVGSTPPVATSPVVPWAAVRIPNGRVDPCAAVSRPGPGVVPWAAILRRPS